MTLIVLAVLAVGALLLAVKSTSAAPSQDVPPVPASPSGRVLYREAFLRHAQNVDWQGIPVDFAWAQSSVETGDNSKNSVFYHGNTKNLFNIKASPSWTGRTYNGFRVYDTWEESMKDWVRLMHTAHYAPALVLALAKDYKGFYRTLKQLGYDTSEPKYAELVQARYEEVV